MIEYNEYILIATKRELIVIYDYFLNEQLRRWKHMHDEEMGYYNDYMRRLIKAYGCK
jgi:hypothetical protein